MTGVQNPWHKLADWWLEEQVGNPSLPLWLRIALLAQVGARRNGHCPFGRNELGVALAVADIETGEIRRPTANRVSEAIKAAIQYNFLDPKSHALCLVPAIGSVYGGTIGKPDERCDRHQPDRRKIPLKPEETGQTFRFKRNLFPLKPETCPPETAVARGNA